MTEEVRKIVEQIKVALPYYREVYELSMQSNALNEKANAKTSKGMNFILFCVDTSILAIVLGFLDFIVTSIGINTFTFIVFCVCAIAAYLVILKFSKRVSDKPKVEAQKQMQECNKKIDQLVSEHQNEMTILPESYRYYIAADFICNVLSNGRADTLKEALNLYEDQIHKWKMEAGQQEMMNVMNQQNSTINAINRNSAISATASVISAVANLTK